MNELLRQFLFLPPQESSVARDIDGLHYFVILVTMAGAVLVTLVGGLFLFRYRRRTTSVNTPNPNATIKPALMLEVAAIAALFALFIGWWIIGSRQYTNLRVPPKDAMDIYVTSKQWMWKFAYPQGNRSLAVLYVPARRPIKLIMTSRDVIHSFYVPEFRIKQDVLPGRYTTVWFEANRPGTYQILCTEYCGMGHSTMRGEVVALDADDFERWLGGDTLEAKVTGPVYIPPATGEPSVPREMLSLVRQGERVAAEQGCLRCHTTDGTPHIGPTWAGLYGSKVPLQEGGEVVVDEAYITESMMDPAVKLHRGYAAVMPSYLGRIRPPETAAIIEFIKSIRSTYPAVPPGGVGGPTYAPIPEAADAGLPAESEGPRGDPPAPGAAPAPPPGRVTAEDGGRAP